MDNQNTFSYNYNAEENQQVNDIRSKYLPRQESPLEQLKAMDAKVKRPANVFAYIYGSLSAIIMGAGMSLVMTDIGATLGMENTMLPGIIIGVVGMALALTTYPIHKKMLASRRKKHAPQILELSEKLMK